MTMFARARNLKLHHIGGILAYPVKLFRNDVPRSKFWCHCCAPAAENFWRRHCWYVGLLYSFIDHYERLILRLRDYAMDDSNWQGRITLQAHQALCLGPPKPKGPPKKEEGQKIWVLQTRLKCSVRRTQFTLINVTLILKQFQKIGGQCQSVGSVGHLLRSRGHFTTAADIARCFGDLLFSA